MTGHEPVLLAAQLGRRLPQPDVRRVADALRSGNGALLALRSDAGGSGLRQACGALLAANLSPEDMLVAAGVLLGVLVPDPGHGDLDVVWSGPDSGLHSARLTSAVVVDLIDQAQATVLLVGYAVHSPPAVVSALQRAGARGVAVTLVLERPEDNPRFSGPSPALAGVTARRLCWPGFRRPAGASLHAKVLVVDEAAALIGSANLTGAALERNVECGLLVRGGLTPRLVAQHVDQLLLEGELRSESP